MVFFWDDFKFLWFYIGKIGCNFIEIMGRGFYFFFWLGFLGFCIFRGVGDFFLNFVVGIFGILFFVGEIGELGFE